MHLSDVRKLTKEDKGAWYVPGLPVPVHVTRVIHLKDQDIVGNRHFVVAMNAEGKKRILYHDSDGYAYPEVEP